MRDRHPVKEASSPPLRLDGLDRVLYCKGYELRQFLRDGAPELLRVLLFTSMAGLAGWLAVSMLF